MSIPPTIEVASLGMWDSLILMVMALVVFGPRRMPEIGRQIGRLMYELRKASSDFKFQMEEELRIAEDADRRKAEEARLNALAQPQPAGTISASTEAEPTATPASTEEAAATESPYPGEEQYPPVEIEAGAIPTAEEAAPEAAAPAPETAEAPPTEEQESEKTGATPEQTSTEPVKENG